ncbi:MAG: glycosyltransferase family protein [Chloroflexota bacterium]
MPSEDTSSPRSRPAASPPHLPAEHVQARQILLAPRRLGDYAPFVAPGLLPELRRLAQPLAGLRVLHLSAGPFGSAVAETLAALVPLQRDLGMAAQWRVLSNGRGTSWHVLYEGLSGGSVSVTSGATNRAGGHRGQGHDVDLARLAGQFDVVIMHDPQLVGLATPLRHQCPDVRWLWHCHLDIRAAQLNLWASLRRSLEPFSGAMFSHPRFVPTDLALPGYVVTSPALDPCNPRNVPLAPQTLRSLVERLGIDPERPLVGQFAPIGSRYASIAALGAYWLAREEVPGLQIVLADISSASPEGQALERGTALGEAEEVRRAAAGDRDIHVLNAQTGLTPAEINALQREVAVALQMAVPRGFGWGLAECQWKGKPAVVGRHGQLPEQVGEPRLNSQAPLGYVVEGAPDAAASLVRILRDRELASGLGLRAREHLSKQHLITQLLGDYLGVFRQLMAQRPLKGDAL